MVKITIKQIDNKKIWEDFMSLHPETNFLQSWYWGEFHKNLGNDIQRTGFYKNNKLIGVMLSVVENAKRGRYLTVPGGPIIDWTGPDLVNSFVNEIKRIAKDTNCVFVRVRPQLESSEFSKKIFRQNGFVNAPIHLHAELTTQLDITKSEEDLLKNMRKTTRYEIKKAISLGIEVTGWQLKSDRRYYENPLIREFYDLQLVTARRQKFVPFSFDFLNEQFKVFSQKNQALLYRAALNNKLLAEAIIIFYGKEAVYHYGTSTDEGRKYPGSYLIQWEAIKEAKKRGMTSYNFWGVSPFNEPNHRFYGLSLFKRGFGGKDVEYLHAQDLVINLPRYLINYIVERIRKKTRGV